MFKTLIMVSALMLPAISPAHEGEHGPSGAQAPKGGAMRSLETVHLELISKGDTVQIFAYDNELKPIDVSKYPVSATVTFPRKKPEVVALAAKGDHWEAEVDAKGAHRYTFTLDIKQGGNQDKLAFTVEPKKK